MTQYCTYLSHTVHLISQRQKYPKTPNMSAHSAREPAAELVNAWFGLVMVTGHT
jgi:hypothetical protein